MSYFHSIITHSMKNLMSYLILMSYLTKCSMNLEKFAISNSNFTVYKYFYRRKIFEPETELIEKKKKESAQDE